jgi:uncharacterized protein DUF397
MTIRWRKSSRSGAGPTNCVELAHTYDAVRDSKNPGGPTLAVDLTALLDSIRTDRLTR